MVFPGDPVSVRRGFFKQIYTGFAQAEVGCCTLADSMPHVAGAIQDLTKGNAMKRSTALTSLLLSVGLLSTGAQSAELAPADRVTPLSEIAEITFNDLPGSPQEAEQAIARTAGQHGASYYRILRMEEQAHPLGWRASAILYL